MRNILTTVAASAICSYVGAAKAEAMDFDPIPASAYAESTTDKTVLDTVPWLIPDGYSQRVVSDETDLNVYQLNDRPAFIVTNETGPQAGRYLYRTHETYPGKDTHLDGTTGGALSVVDLETGATRLLATRADWEVLDGLTWTPWGSLLFAEETDEPQYPDPDYPDARRGLVYELKLNKDDPTVAQSVTALPSLGAVRHEAVEFDRKGNVYLSSSNRDSYIYKFVPKKRGNLSKGKLYALRVKTGGQTGAAKWVPLDMKRARIDAHEAARAANATPYCNPEDIELIGQKLYVAVKCEPRIDGVDGPGVILSVTLGNQPKVAYFVEVGKNVPAQNAAAGISGFFRPETLAEGPDGKLWITEDTQPSDIWVADTHTEADGLSSSVKLFASLKDAEATGTGIYFGADAGTLYVNVHESATGNDKTMAITGQHGH
ncbi:alkaline phosphatase PhoX [Methylococcus capsulatus]|uniref:alkaline phosphatase PhoX n=1 Tax=Methylococcus capsulatus TaxID=414 RepID=UPI002FDB0529